ncbi:hypothetical protein ACIQBJ_00845 [Kitasatospora sp. NPDC088391]|uniref:hypothetical protein n=1 Tax=Kitasatospora sp. NPDC088391 TaxID=3364074 RepID=UPI0037F8F0A0
MRVLRGALLSGGLALIGCGLVGLLTDRYVSDPLGVLWWAAGLVAVHDGLWLPLVCAVGAVAGRRVLRGRPVLRDRPVLRGWLVVVAAVGAVAGPAVLRAGHDGGNATLLPLPYLRNWLLFLAAGGAGAALLAVVRRSVARRNVARRSTTRRTAARRSVRRARRGGRW